MEKFKLFSRRTDATVDFRPDEDRGSPSKQLRRLLTYLTTNIAEADDITDCPDALNYLREYTYRKIFTGTSHKEFVELDSKDPAAIDWLIAVHETESSNFRRQK